VKWTPHPYQKRAVKHLLAEPAAGLFLDPGLGKTSVVLKAFEILRKQEVLDSMLVIAPLQVCLNVWQQEVVKWEFDFNVEILHGPAKEDRLLQGADIFVINPEGLSWLARQKNWTLPKMLVVDESTKFKNTQTQRFKLLKKWLGDFHRRVLLTGTPMPKSLEDLFGQIYLLDYGQRLGAYITRYRTQYFIPDRFGHQWTPKPDSYERVLDQISDVCLHMAGEDYLELPDRIETKIEFDLPRQARKEYEQLEAAFFVKIEGETVDAVNAAALSTKLRQLVNGAVYVEDCWVSSHDTKLDLLDDLIEGISEPMIVAYEFDHDRQRILDRYPTAEVLGGKTPKKKAQALIEEWNEGGVPLMLLHPASAGHGINLQAGGHHICWFGLTWNLEYYDQTNARLWRQGQEKPVFVYHLMGRDTLDERVFSVLTAKSKRQDALLVALKKEKAWRKKRRSTSPSRRI
jgi:SNF2 family DNA or RNA helicase